MGGHGLWRIYEQRFLHLHQYVCQKSALESRRCIPYMSLSNEKCYDAANRVARETRAFLKIKMWQRVAAATIVNAVFNRVHFFFVENFSPHNMQCTQNAFSSYVNCFCPRHTQVLGCDATMTSINYVRVFMFILTMRMRAKSVSSTDYSLECLAGAHIHICVQM